MSAARGLRRPLLASALVILGMGALGAFLYRGELLPERSPAERGREVARRAGCFGCHGEHGDGAPNRSRGEASAGEFVPPFCAAESATEAEAWVRDGIAGPEARSPAHAAAAAKKLIHMPAYAGRLADAEVADLVAWLVLERSRSDALGQRGEPTPLTETALARGERLSRAFGCFACHGELGQGGVTNPGALKGYVPGFFGRDFELLTFGARPDAVREWIRDGIARAMADSRLGRYFTGRSALMMPGFAGFATPEEIEALVEYTLALHRQGPMDANAIEGYLARTKGKEP